MFVKISRCVPDVPCVPAIWIHSALRVAKFFQCLHSILLSPHLIGGFRVLLYQPKATTEYPFDLFDVLPLALLKKTWAALAFYNLEGRCEIFTGDIISQWSCATFFLPSKCFDPPAMGPSENSPNESRSTMPSMAPTFRNRDFDWILHSMCNHFSIMLQSWGWEPLAFQHLGFLDVDLKKYGIMVPPNVLEDLVLSGPGVTTRTAFA